MRVGKLIQREFWAKNPIKIVNLCFLFVFLCSILLIWRELVVLEEAYVSSQHNSLENVASALDRHLQYSADKMIFYRNAMQSALELPISTDLTRRMLQEFDIRRQQNFWELRLDQNRSMPINGVSDSFVKQSEPLVRNDALLHNELSAALEFGYFMHFSSSNSDLQARTYYTSRGGFYIANEDVPASPAIISR